MRMKPRGSDFLVAILFSLFLLITASGVKADTGSKYLVEAQANTTSANTAVEAPGNTLAASTNPVEGQGNTLSASVSGVSTLPEVTVKAKGIDQAQAFDEMHDSLNKVNILSQDQINQTPAKTIAQAAEELPGVGTQHDTSEPRYIDIRGTDSDFNIVTFNDTIIPSYDESNRSVDLDDIPAGLVGEMEVFKTILPDMDAQGIGGQLNLVPKYASDYPDGLLELKAEGEYFPERNQPGVMGWLTWADTYNLGGKTNLGIVVDGGYQYSRFGIDDLEDVYSDPGTDPVSPHSVSDYEFRYYDYERDRAGIGTNINLDFDREDKLYYNLMYSGYDEYRMPVWHTVYNNLDAYASDGSYISPDGTITLPDVEAQANPVDVEKTMTTKLEQYRTLATGLGGQNDLGGFILDYKASFSYACNNQPYDYGYEFKNTNVTGSLTYNNTPNNGNSPTFNFSGLNGTDTNPDNYILDGGATNGTDNYQVAQYGAKADGKFDIPLGGDDTSTVKFGTAARLEYSTYVNYNYTASPTAVLQMSTVLGPSNLNFYPGGIYNMGPLPGVEQTESLLNNPNPYVGPYQEIDPVGDQGGDYNNWEDVYAAYAMDTIKSGNMEVMGGVRVEVTHIDYNWWSAYAYDSNGNPTTELSAAIPENGAINYANVLPSLGMKYTFNPTFLTRVNYSQTISRPTQNEYIPDFSLPQALSAQVGDAIAQFVIGNPNLKPIVSNNIDSSWEFYPEKGSILSCDFFLKDITNYIAQNYSQVDNSGGVTQWSSYYNIPTADIYGAEFQYQQQYTMLPGILGGLGFRGSISFIGSEGELAPGVYGELPSQSDLIWETGIFYKKDGLTFDVSGNFTGKNLTVVGDPNTDNSPNQYYDDYFQINAKVQYAFTKDFTVYADGDNLNNADLRYYEISPQYPIQNEYYQPSCDLGVDITF